MNEKSPTRWSIESLRMCIDDYVTICRHEPLATPNTAPAHVREAALALVECAVYLHVDLGITVGLMHEAWQAMGFQRSGFGSDPDRYVVAIRLLASCWLLKPSQLVQG